MKHKNFTAKDIAAASAIVSIFETGRPTGDPAAVAVLDDGAGVSYGVKQFTHRSGSLAAVVERYLASGAEAGKEILSARMPLLRKTTRSAIAKLAADAEFKRALKAAGATAEMRRAQDGVAYEMYIAPAIAECSAMGFGLPLSLAVVMDSKVHGSYERVRDAIGAATDEKKWIGSYVEARHSWLERTKRLAKTSYRTAFFLRQIRLSNWQLRTPMNVHGRLLTDKMFSFPEALAPQIPAEIPPTIPPESHQAGRGEPVAAPAKGAAEVLDELEAKVNSIAARVDQTERIALTAATRTDKAKSMWTTVAGTAWQAVWAIAGLIAGVPREVWLVVAIVAAALMLMFLYRQIALGRIREVHRS